MCAANSALSLQIQCLNLKKNQNINTFILEIKWAIDLIQPLVAHQKAGNLGLAIIKSRYILSFNMTYLRDYLFQETLIWEMKYQNTTTTAMLAVQKYQRSMFIFQLVTWLE